MTLLAGRVVTLLEQPESETFHFGYAFFEPLLNTVRGLLIMTVVAVGIGSAVLALTSGGRELKPGLALIYSIIVGAICFLLSWTQSRYARQTGSPILRVDARTWMIDGVLTVAVGIAFLASLFLSWSAWSQWLPYVDPLVVIILGTVMFVTPLRIVINNAGQLLHAAPDPETQHDIRQRIESATGELAIETRDVRMFRVGRYFYLLIRLVVGDQFPRSEIAELDNIRKRIAAALRDCEPQVALDIVFTHDQKWIPGLLDHDQAKPNDDKKISTLLEDRAIQKENGKSASTGKDGNNGEDSG